MEFELTGGGGSATLTPQPTTLRVSASSSNHTRLPSPSGSHPQLAASRLDEREAATGHRVACVVPPPRARPGCRRRRRSGCARRRRVHSTSGAERAWSSALVTSSDTSSTASSMTSVRETSHSLQCLRHEPACPRWRRAIRGQLGRRHSGKYIDRPRAACRPMTDACDATASTPPRARAGRGAIGTSAGATLGNGCRASC